MNLEEKIKAHVAYVATFADLLPSVVIVHKIADGSVIWMNKRGLSGLDIPLEDLVKLGDEAYYSKYFNPEDTKDYVPKILGLLERNNDDEILTFFQQVKINKQDFWTWHMTSTRITLRDDLNQPVLLLTLSLPIESMHTMTLKADKILQENNFLRANIASFSKLSKRELEILKHLARGESATECGEMLFISPQTVETHRKNIRKKLGTNSFFELSQYARAFDLISLFFIETAAVICFSFESLFPQFA